MEPPDEIEVVQFSLKAQPPDPLRALLISNSEWVEGVLRFQPDFFKISAYVRQTPRVRQYSSYLSRHCD